MAVTLNGKGKTHATSLVDSGKVDETSDWSFSAEDSDKLLGDPPDWSAYSQMFLGKDSEADAETKAAWKYPFGKDGQVYRSALRAIASRASQQNETEISDAASVLIRAIDDKNAADLETLTVQALSQAPERRTLASRPWYGIQGSAEGADAADVNIYDAIGAWYDGVSAKQFLADLSALPETVKTINLHVNSPGGDVFDAIAIANGLRAHRAKVLASIEGLAASAATIVTQGGSDEVLVADNAIVMIHDPYGFAMGTAKDMRDTAAALDRSRDAIVATYRRKSPLSAKKLETLMAETTWMSADEAIANGFADRKTKGLKAANTIDPEAIAALGAIPEPYREAVQSLQKPKHVDLVMAIKVDAADVDAAVEKITESVVDAKVIPEPEPVVVIPAASAEAVLALCREAGIQDLEFASDIISCATQEADVRQLISAEKERRAAEAERRDQIISVCKLAGSGDLAEQYIKGGMPVELVKAQLVTVTAKVDAARGQIDTSLRADLPAGRTKPVIDVVAIYAALNARR